VVERRAGDGPHFVAAWRRVVDPAQGSPNADILRPVLHAADIIAGRAPVTALGVSAPQDNRLVVQLERPAPYFPELLTHSATFPIYSEEAAATHDAAQWVSNGAYVYRIGRSARALSSAEIANTGIGEACRLSASDTFR
jgi:ABC-type oligopeptide transport system substrate-binding subunit